MIKNEILITDNMVNQINKAMDIFQKTFPQIDFSIQIFVWTDSDYLIKIGNADEDPGIAYRQQLWHYKIVELEHSKSTNYEDKFFVREFGTAILKNEEYKGSESGG